MTVLTAVDVKQYLKRLGVHTVNVTHLTLAVNSHAIVI